jgi:hypothetical protein
MIRVSRKALSWNVRGGRAVVSSRIAGDIAGHS